MVKRKGHFMEKLCTIDNINLADDNARMNLKTGLNYSNFVGKKDKISNYRGRSVYLVHVDLKHRYYNLQFIYKGCPIQVRSKSQKLINLVGRDNPPQIIIL